MRLSALLFAAIVLCTACGNKSTESELPAGSAVLALGDSLTEGAGVAREEAWPALLESMTDWIVINGGVSGDTSEAALRRLPSLLDRHDPDMVLVNPNLTDGAYYGPSRGHLFPSWARRIGMPRAYGYGASMGAWILDYIGGWAGEWGRIVHCNSQYRGPAFTGDVTVMTGEISGKVVDGEGLHVVKLDVKMANHLGTTMATAKAEVELPKKG